MTRLTTPPPLLLVTTFTMRVSIIIIILLYGFFCFYTYYIFTHACKLIEKSMYLLEKKEIAQGTYHITIFSSFSSKEGLREIGCVCTDSLKFFSFP